MVQERSKLMDLEIMLQNWLPVGTVTEEDAASPDSLSDSLEGCFSCGVLTHTTDQCQTLDESFPFFPYLGTARSLVGCGFRLPCSDSDDSDDDVLSIGPLWPVATAAPLGGAEGHDDEVLQINPRHEWSVNSRTADDSCGVGCAQLVSSGRRSGRGPACPGVAGGFVRQ